MLSPPTPLHSQMMLLGCGSSGSGDSTPAVPADAWLMEDGLSGWLMEDGSSFWLMEI